jgi:hypothetical protein
MAVTNTRLAYRPDKPNKCSLNSVIVLLYYVIVLKVFLLATVEDNASCGVVFYIIMHRAVSFCNYHYVSAVSAHYRA